MKDKDIETRLRQCFSGDPPLKMVKQHALSDSTAMLICAHRRRLARRRAKLVAAAVLIAGIAFLGGRLSVPRELPGSSDDTLRVTGESDGITVASDLVAWVDAARLFKQLGMEDRMAEAVENAGKLLPSDDVATSSVMRKSNTGTGDGVFENQNKYSILAEILRPDESVDHVGGILAQSFGGHYYESKMD